MPLAKPTEVILHRISFSEKEREMLEGIAAGKTIEAAGKGAVYVVGAGALAGGLYVTWWCLEKVYGWMGNAGDYFSTLNQQVAQNIAGGSTGEPDILGQENPSGIPPTIQWLRIKLGLA